MKTTTPRYMAVQGAALLIACVFLTVGLLGFIPGVTTDYGLLQWAGHQPGAKLFGVFAVSGVHNVVHLALGVVGLMLTRSYAEARAYLLGGGLAYLAVWVARILHRPQQGATSARLTVPTTGCTSGSGGPWWCWASPSPVSATRPSDVGGSNHRNRQRRYAIDSAMPSRMSCSLTTSSPMPARSPVRTRAPRR